MGPRDQHRSSGRIGVEGAGVSPSGTDLELEDVFILLPNYCES